MNENKKRNLKRVIVLVATLASFLLGAKHPKETEQILTTLTATL